MGTALVVAAALVVVAVAPWAGPRDRAIRPGAWPLLAASGAAAAAGHVVGSVEARPVAALGLLLWLTGRLGLVGADRRRVRKGADVLVVSACMLFLVWGPHAFELAGGATGQVSAVLGVLAAATALTALAWSPGPRWPSGLVAVGTALLAVSWSGVGDLAVFETSGWLGVAAGALAGTLNRAAPAGDRPGAGGAFQVVLLAAPVAAAVGVAGWWLADGTYFEPTLGIVALAAVVLVLGRQALSIAEGRMLARDLEREVQARTADLRASEVRFRSLVQSSSDVITVVDEDGVVLFQTPSVERVLGFEPADHHGRAVDELCHPDDLDRARRVLAAAVADPLATFTVEWRLRTAAGAWAHCETLVRSLLHEPSVAGLVLNTRDVSERRALEHQLMKEAFHDPLTGLANRLLLRDRINHALAGAAREGSEIAVLLVDLDDFKAVNDGLGHAAGDHVLTTVADRLRQCVRPGDTVARLGGDEFAVLLERVTYGQPEHVAGRIVDLLRQPLLVAGHEVFTPASIGIAPGAGAAEADEMLRNADVAMYTAKGRGKSQHATFVPEMQEAMRGRLTLATELRRAVSTDQFALRYQPFVDLKTRRVVGAEALVRWRHPTRGLVSAVDFIPLAEATGVIVPLGSWVLERAAEALAGWHRLQPAGELPLSVTVNVSARQFQEEGLVDLVRDVLRSTGIAPRSLVLELTESLLVDDVDGAIEMLRELKATGVRLALDDFGTGYSSLSYLRRLPIDILKIDKSFVDGLGTVEGPGVVRSILRLGDTFRIATLAEGVELSEHHSMLRALGCTYGQGYLFSKPLRPADMEELAGGGRAHEADGPAGVTDFTLK